MAKIKIGTIFGKNIFSGNPSDIRNGEYFIKTAGQNIIGLFYKQNGKLVQIGGSEEKELKLEEVKIFNQYHGDKTVIVPKEGYDAIGSIVVKKPKLEEKDTIKITKNGITEIKVGKGYDGLDDVTVIVNVEQKTQE